MTPTYDGPLAGIPTDEATVRKLDRTHVFHSSSAVFERRPSPLYAQCAATPSSAVSCMCRVRT